MDFLQNSRIPNMFRHIKPHLKHPSREVRIAAVSALTAVPELHGEVAYCIASTS